MSLLFESMDRIALLAKMADVHGTPRVSITFDTPSDSARFKAEAERQIAQGGLRLTWNGALCLSECQIHGIKLRVM